MFTWEANGRLAGKFHSSGNISLFEVYNASHMVSVDVPDSSMDMFYRSIKIKHDLFETNMKVSLFFSRCR